ncbi:MAG: hypothetical protein AAF360_02785 [Pseudomonadota bacterium]
MRAHRFGRTSLLVIAAGAAFALSACREEEQDRILLFDKGEYLGQEDAALDADAVETLRERARSQGF